MEKSAAFEDQSLDYQINDGLQSKDDHHNYNLIPYLLVPE